MPKILEYPTMEQVEEAAKEQLETWYEWLRGPETDIEYRIERRIHILLSYGRPKEE
jgi:hypothetical protein